MNSPDQNSLKQKDRKVPGTGNYERKNLPSVEGEADASIIIKEDAD
jgi:hypothetical protein